MGPRTAARVFRAEPRHQPSTGNTARPFQYCRLITVFLCSALASSGCQKKEEAPPPSPPDVQVTEVTQQSVPIYSEWVAQLNGPNNAVISPRVQGYLLRQNYKNGFFVKKGQLLYEIDPRPFIVAVDQSKAQVAGSEANLSQANTNVNRDKPLVAQNAIAQKQLDTDLATQAAGQAQLDASKAALAQAQLNLSWTKVYSPIDGIAGVSTAQVGNLVGTATTMTTISQVNPIWAYFNISESDFLSRASTFYDVISGKRIKSPSVQFIQSNGETYPKTGKIIQISRNIASETGTAQLAAEFPNKEALLRPGGFGRVRFLTSVSQNALLVPQAAVIETQSMYMVAIVGPDNRAAFRPVQVGNKVGQNWIITKGLAAGEKVIVEGFMKVKEGTPVVVKPYVAQVAGND
jgi:membrane fusion protein, multidrug efflux system